MGFRVVEGCRIDWFRIEGLRVLASRVLCLENTTLV